MDTGTYGDSPAAQQLAQLLTDIPDEESKKKIVRKLGATWMDHTEAMLELRNIKRPRVRRRLRDISWDATKRIISNFQLGDGKRFVDIKTYFLNVCTARYREVLQWEKENGQDRPR